MSIDVYNPATEEVIGSVPETADVDPAVAAARAALGPGRRCRRPSAPRTSPRCVTSLAAHADELAATDHRRDGRAAHGRAARSRSACRSRCCPRWSTCSAADSTEERIGNSLIVRDPVGVVGGDHPVELPAAPDRSRSSRRRSPPAAPSCTSRARSRRCRRYLLRRRWSDEAGLPDGRLQPRHRLRRPGRGAALAGHPGRRPRVVHRLDRRRPRRVGAGRRAPSRGSSLELGGKSANVILPDADLDRRGQGRRRQLLAQLRPDLHRVDPDAGARAAARRGGRARVAAAAAVHRRRPDRPGHPARPAGLRRPARPGAAAISPRGVADGARLVTDGRDAPCPTSATSSRPTVFADVDPDSTIAQEEIFGPVLSIIPYRDEDDAVAHRQRHPLRPGRQRLVRLDTDARARGRPADAHRAGRHQRRRVQPARPVRRVQALRHTAGSSASHGSSRVHVR